MARIGRVSLNCGITYYKLGAYNKASESLRSGLAALEQSSDRLNQTRTHIALGNVHRLTRDFTTARKHLMTAYTMATDLEVPREECLALEFLGDVYRDENKADEAQRYYQRGLAIGERIAPEGDLVMELHRRQGECMIHQGQVGQGVELLAKARSHAKKLGDRFEEGVIMRCLAEGLHLAGHLDEALDYAHKAAAQLEHIEARHEHAIACLTAAEILLDLSRDTTADEPRDKLDAAWEHALTAQNICRQLDIDFWNNAVKKVQSRIARRRAEEAKYEHTSPRGGQGRVDSRPGDVIIAESRAMKESLEAVEVFAPYDEPILLTGETGTGKEVLAQLAHKTSARADKAFVATNITAIPHSMFEREFFGHVKGSFSGADADRKGLVAEADGGTLFLDEIGDLAPQTQAKLLRVLQDGSYLCLGDPVERRADLRIIAATNIDLEEAVKKKQFREDLYYRLAILTIPIPALRDRPEDIRPLLDHFLSTSAGRQVTADDYFNDTSIKLMENYGWPGNVREVALVARRAFITQHTLGQVEVALGVGDEAMVLRGKGARAVVSVAAAAAGGQDGGASAPALSRARILLALEETNGNRSEAARRLGVSRATFYRRLTRLGIG